MKPQAKTRPQQHTIECLVCKEIIDVGGKPQVGVIVECKNCESLFEIVELEPLMIDWPYYDDEFNDDEDLYDYDL
ncbi:MAG: hypothetical protein ACWGOY_07290 [Anaerolineales bacterium]